MPIRYAGRYMAQPLSVGAIVLTAILLIELWYAFARRLRRTSTPDLAMGALLPMLAGMAVTAMAFPALSFVFTWPLLFSLLAGANGFYRFPRPWSSKTVMIGLLLSGSASIIILGPTIVLGLFDQMVLTLLLLGVLCGYLLSLSAVIVQPN